MISENERELLLKRLKEDLIGPYKEDEILDSKPSDVYLTGILWPGQTRFDENQDEKSAADGVSGDDGSDGSDEEISASSMNRPSVAGVSFSVSSDGQDPSILVSVSFAEYERITEVKKDESADKERKKHLWKRNPYILEDIPVSLYGSISEKISLEKFGGPQGVYLHIRTIYRGGVFLSTVTLLNERKTDRSSGRIATEEASLFQTEIKIWPSGNTKLIPRPSSDVLPFSGKDDEERSTALLYRNSLEFATGHTCSAEWEEDQKNKNHALFVKTSWVPQVKVKATSPLGHEIFRELEGNSSANPLSADLLSSAPDDEMKEILLKLPILYHEWIASKKSEVGEIESLYKVDAEQNLENCLKVMERMKAGAIRIAGDPVMAEAFRLANQAIVLQHSWNKERSKEAPFKWRPFQLGFILLSAESVADSSHPDRNVMDLLWFPTGGGKTEAYLALIAFITFYRRLSRDDPDEGAGVAAVMRYTLRLLTTQQFTRSAALMLACEAIRRGKTGYNNYKKLGNVPFSIGLWVGGGATPNNYEEAKGSFGGGRGDEKTAASPKQLLNCPACGRKLNWTDDKKNKRINVRCNNCDCILYNESKPLPVYTVDSDIYSVCPTLLIGTVDKFAQIVRRSEIKELFGIDINNPPDLIVQDELHLISGPLGTVSGLYEVAVDRLFTRNDRRPKIIGSTATIRRADDQIRALFDRDTCQFPPSGIDAGDSGFAVIDNDAPGRFYAAVTTAGRSNKFTLQAVSASLVQSARSGIADIRLADPYWTLVTYFNSLRELGGALVLMQDDVSDSISVIAERRKEGKGYPERIEELTSRRSQDEVRDMLEGLAIKAGEDDVIDIILATNMLSVGVDIPRLGLMVVDGQPKGISEYIQATSRVGRGKVPGLVISVLNNAKVRDRSRYETFVTWHNTLYRDVEATSVTPFASRSRDRALRAVLVSLVRHLATGMSEKPEFSEKSLEETEGIIRYIVSRAKSIDSSETEVGAELGKYLEEWRKMSPEYYLNRREQEKSLLQDAEAAATKRATGRSPGKAWPVMNNMRSVETSTPFKLRRGLKNLNEGSNE
ncbi:DNA/RNA helicase [Methanoplanus sp. FWC-SCC4]|uniref:DNA/RNA helicase n=1 Tax=Methanochimaera problematica TaxID=2609417 RepID=A0AA97I2Y4_9EURY|nr:helicase-related protein [Methanoplanus sp. FWC-SCC4]WOF16785.1 DNA/RNA helicase [Methanoplanus sp. FWC-SCC4]